LRSSIRSHHLFSGKLVAYFPAGEIPQKDFQKRELSAEPKVRHSKKEWKLLKGKFFKKDRKVLPPQDLVKLESSVECEGTQLEPERAGTSQQDIDSLEWPVERTRSEEELEELKGRLFSKFPGTRQ
jgi:hypothetical protein